MCFVALQLQRLQNEVLKYKQQVAQWEQMVAQARTACDAWQRDAEENNRKANIAEKQRDEVSDMIFSIVLSVV